VWVYSTAAAQCSNSTSPEDTANAQFAVPGPDQVMSRLRVPSRLPVDHIHHMVSIWMIDTMWWIWSTMMCCWPSSVCNSRSAASRHFFTVADAEWTIVDVMVARFPVRHALLPIDQLPSMLSDGCNMSVCIDQMTLLIRYSRSGCLLQRLLGLRHVVSCSWR